MKLRQGREEGGGWEWTTEVGGSGILGSRDGDSLREGGTEEDGEG